MNFAEQVTWPKPENTKCAEIREIMDLKLSVFQVTCPANLNRARYSLKPIAPALNKLVNPLNWFIYFQFIPYLFYIYHSITLVSSMCFYPAFFKVFITQTPKRIHLVAMMLIWTTINFCILTRARCIYCIMYGSM